MENTTKPTMFQSTFTWGAIIGLAGIVYSLILYFMDLSLNKPAGYVSIVILIAGLYFGIKAYRDQGLDGYMTYGKAVGTGVMISMFNAIIASIFAVILYKFIAPDLIDKIMAQSQDRMSERGMSEDQIEKGIEVAKKFFIVSAFVGGLFMSVLVGTIISLILAIFLKKEGDPFNRDMSAIKPE